MKGVTPTFRQPLKNEQPEEEGTHHVEKRESPGYLSPAVHQRVNARAKGFRLVWRVGGGNNKHNQQERGTSKKRYVEWQATTLSGRSPGAHVPVSTVGCG